MSNVKGTTTIDYHFDIDEIEEFVGSVLTPVQRQKIANILAANVEDPSKFDARGNVLIIRSNFNDAFYDMEADLQEEYT